mmetsp:Transcript_99194/g.283738  ORF Transcript_99194/g.283738 Transcript_99194/m.283738 type:complete len:525 (+) Transcript_99194:697-2271(+)
MRTAIDPPVHTPCRPLPQLHYLNMYQNMPTPSPVAASWLLVEFVMLTALRAGSEGTFRFQIAGADTFLGSLIIDIVLYVLSIGAPFFLLRFPGYLGPSIYLLWCLYQLAVNPIMIAVGLQLDGRKEQVDIELSEGLLLLAVAVAAFMALVGFAVSIAFMNHGCRKTFLGRLSFRQYLAELWESRTWAPIGKGLDASRADLISFSRFYWPPNDKVKAWLEPNWDGWVAAPPQWFTSSFVQQIAAGAPPEVLPIAVLQDLAEKHSGKGVGQEESSTRQLSIGASTRQPSSRQFATTSRKELVQMEEKRRANRAFTHAKQLGIWAAALVFSYVDLGTTVVVGREYLSMGTAQGRHAAHMTFGMLGVSLGIQTMATHWTGQGTLASLATMTGGKMLLDTFHIMTGRNPAGDVTSGTALVGTRFMLVVLDSLPQSAAQMFLVAGLDDANPSALMLCSIVGCVLSIAFLVATTELDIDLSKHYRTNLGTVHGYYVENSATMQGLVLVGTVFFCDGVSRGKAYLTGNPHPC